MSLAIGFWFLQRHLAQLERTKSPFGLFPVKIWTRDHKNHSKMVDPCCVVEGTLNFCSWHLFKNGLDMRKITKALLLNCRKINGPKVWIDIYLN